MPIADRHATETLKDHLQGILRDVLELLAEISHREFELRGHAIESDQGI